MVKKIVKKAPYKVAKMAVKKVAKKASKKPVLTSKANVTAQKKLDAVNFRLAKAEEAVAKDKAAKAKLSVAMNDAKTAAIRAAEMAKIEAEVNAYKLTALTKADKAAVKLKVNLEKAVEKKFANATKGKPKQRNAKKIKANLPCDNPKKTREIIDWVVNGDEQAGRYFRDDIGRGVDPYQALIYRLVDHDPADQHQISLCKRISRLHLAKLGFSL